MDRKRGKKASKLAQERGKENPRIDSSIFFLQQSNPYFSKNQAATEQSTMKTD
jgi:hypothetical protein